MKARPGALPARRLTRLLTAIPCFALLVLAFFAATVQAGTVTSYMPTGQIGTAGSSSGQLEGPTHVAVDQSTGDLYVADPGNARVEKFSAAGAFVLMFGKGVNQTTSGDVCAAVSGNVCQAGTSDSAGFLNAGFVAVDNSGGPSDGDVYVADLGSNVVKKYDSQGNFLTTYDGSSSGSTFGSLAGIAIDASGNLWVDDQGSQVREFGPGGAFITQWNSNRGASTPSGIAVDSTTHLYIVGGPGGVEKFDSAGVYEGNVTPQVGDTTGLAIDPATDDLFVDHADKTVDQIDSSCDPSGGPCAPIENFGFGELTAPAGLAVRSSSGDVYVADTGAKHVAAFSLLSGTVPDVTIDPTTALTIYTAHFSGSVNPLSVNNSWHFEWKQSSQGWASAQSSPSQSAPVDSSEHPVSYDVTGLDGGTTYDVRLVGVNTDNKLRGVSGQDQFTTQPQPLPVAIVEPVSGISQNAAAVSGTVNPEGASTTWWVETSSNPECASGVGFGAGPQHSIPAGSSPAPVSEELSGLLPSQDYCVRIGAVNNGGPANSAIVEFTTGAILPDQVETIPPAPRTDTTAQLNARLNPQGKGTSYHFEYSVDGSSWVALPLRSAISARRQIVVGDELTGLQPDTTYRFRFLASNSAGPASPQGAERSFKTRTTAEATLETRGVELINTPNKGNQHIKPMSLADPTPISADGNEAFWEILAGAPGATTGSGNSFVAVRTPDGWKSESLIATADQQVGGGNLNFHPVAASTDHSHFLYTTAEGFSAESDVTLIRSDRHNHQESLISLGSIDYRQVAERTDYSDDLSHVFRVNEETNRLFDFGSGTPVEVGLMPNGQPPTCGISGFYESTLQYHWVATEDASHVFFATRGDNCADPSSLYVRLPETSTTRLISPEAAFIRATPDGKAALFSTGLALTSEDQDLSSDIYRWEEGDGEETSVTCVSCAVPGTVTDRELTKVSPDLSHIYFASLHALVPGQGSELESEGISNLYVLRDDGSFDYVGVFGLDFGLNALLESQISSDGNVLAYQANTARPTAANISAQCEPTENIGAPHPCIEIYRYDDLDRSLECVSCAREGITNGDGGAGVGRGYLLSADGSTVAFDAKGPLVAADVNNRPDIYQWRNGSIGLITDGVTEFPDRLGNPALRGIDDSGHNIVFTVAARITGFEHDGLSNLFDARIGGGFQPPTQPAICNEDSCQGPLQAVPAIKAPGSASVSGPANESSKAKKRKHHKRKHAKGRHRKRGNHRSTNHKDG